jgi:UDP-N-acetylglucosamine:LPS N-acetylglucosamine transferase
MPQTPVLHARCIVAVGWIYRSPGLREGITTANPTVLVATGGGGTSETARALYATIDAMLARVRQQTPPFKVVQAIGPRAMGFGRLAQADRIIDPEAALDLLFRDADLVISTAGYNSVLELAVTDTPTLLVPIPRSIDDQTARARFWGPFLGAWHDENAPSVATDWLSQQIASPIRRAPVALGPSGEDRAAKAILRLG